MSLVALGINHATASVSVRAVIVFPDQLDEALGQTVCLTGVAEIAILSTCNRTELYACGEALSDETLIQWLCQFHGISPRRGHGQSL